MSCDNHMISCHGYHSSSVECSPVVAKVVLDGRTGHLARDLVREKWLQLLLNLQIIEGESEMKNFSKLFSNGLQ